ncbi:MAG: hypothetical protein H6713_33680 [Myxococcales bacterium]|nr:hypothetical protein [Myxococcales bacterium]MCB9754914.1 hypothetical protein [Myxococcales bacterium]
MRGLIDDQDVRDGGGARWARAMVGASLLVIACGDSEGETGATASDSGTSDVETSAATSAGTTAGTTGGASGVTTGDSAGASTSTTSSAASTDDPGTTSPSDQTKFDLGALPDGGDGGCGDGGDDDLVFSNIWISNSPQGTVSKIDTETMVELGRYYTDAGQAGDPSRTSVNLQGDVAVVNRAGGITKIAASEERCVDKNNNGVIDTSTGPNDLLGYAAEECILWTTPLPAASRPAAWTSGEKVGEGCNAQYINAKVWTSAPTGADAYVYLLDGDTGEIEGQVLVPGANGGLGIYGGAVDPVNDFWGVTYSAGPLVHVRFEDLSYETIPLPNPSAYGFTVDSQGRSWVGGWSGILQRYDPETQTWTAANMAGYSGLSRGMMEDQSGHLWIAGLSTSALLRVDTDSATLIEALDAAVLPGVATPTGASVDYNGTVWMVDQSKSGGGAFVYEPETQEVNWVGGLQGPYTYSDMTGWALGNVANPQG